jgi:hypothetical protein
VFKLSFNLPSYERAISHLADSLRDELHNRDELLGMFPIRTVIHTGTAMMCGEPEFLESPYRLHAYSHSTEINIFNETDAVGFKEFLSTLLTRLLDNYKEHTIEVLNQTTDITGNKVDALNQNIWDAYIEAIEKVEMRFDEDGAPNFVIYPPKFYEKLSEAKPTIQQTQMINQIFKRKWQEHQANRKTRRLNSEKY